MFCCFQKHHFLFFFQTDLFHHCSKKAILEKWQITISKPLNTKHLTLAQQMICLKPHKNRLKSSWSRTYLSNWSRTLPSKGVKLVQHLTSHTPTVELLSGPSLAIWGVVIWAKFALMGFQHIKKAGVIIWAMLQQIWPRQWTLLGPDSNPSKWYFCFF